MWHEWFCFYILSLWITLALSVNIIWSTDLWISFNKWLKHAGHYDLLLIKRLVAPNGTSEFNVSSALVIMTSTKLYSYIHNCKHSFQLDHERILVAFWILLKRRYEMLDVCLDSNILLLFCAVVYCFKNLLYCSYKLEQIFTDGWLQYQVFLHQAVEVELPVKRKR